jgi:hypothetical protein
MPQLNGVPQNYKYNGKEIQTELGYNVERDTCLW